MSKDNNPLIVKLPNVRLSFPSLTEFEMFEGKPTGKYASTFLINKKSQKALIKEVDDAIQAAIVAAWPDKKTRPKQIILTFKDGDEETYEGYANMMALKASRKSRPILLGPPPEREVLSKEEADDMLYAGCYVNASVDFNASKDGYGKARVWCNLRGVQFRRDGDRFSSGTPVDVDEEFDDFSDDETESADVDPLFDDDDD